MHRVINHKFGRSKIGFFAGTVALSLLAANSLLAVDNETAAAPPPPFYQTTAFYWLLPLALAAAVFGAWRFFQHWRRRAKRQRDEEVFKLVDQWTKSLRQEVDERKQAQRALQESQEFILRSERLAAVGQLAAGLAHEFNNILTVVQGHAFLLMNKPDLDEESHKSVNCINDGVERTARLIKQMLALSRKQVMMRRPLGLKQNLTQTGDMLGRILGEQVVLTFEIAPDLPPIMADADMLQQIVLNLVVNARDAMSRGGRLTICADEAKFAPNELSANTNRKPGRFVRLSVADTGSGMDTAIISHLFEPFFTTKDVGKGAGLGLATVHGMVNQHQGWIEVESKIGKGTRFDIFFPAAGDSSTDNALPKVESPGVHNAKGTILMIEDQITLRQLVRDVLHNDGYEVLEASDVAHAVQMWESSPSGIDLALIDASAHNVESAGEVSTRLWQDNPRLPVIFICDTAQDMPKRDVEAGRSVTRLSKPYQPAQLVQAVREALDPVVAAAPQP